MQPERLCGACFKKRPAGASLTEVVVLKNNNAPINLNQATEAQNRHNQIFFESDIIQQCQGQIKVCFP
ncbi:hypothetical protein DSLASN_32870 [Desulfoluna limicola]|uniref:Uncharacterized protein n=1 Tax=Desulfoluna limicola TaxID=2810562 RepID=A0ABM7PK52_9BACT|nr:hypothetical protein DSLASN_32870 [Desulfoluna limicola]